MPADFCCTIVKNLYEQRTNREDKLNNELLSKINTKSVQRENEPRMKLEKSSKNVLKNLIKLEIIYVSVKNISKNVAGFGVYSPSDRMLTNANVLLCYAMICT